MLGWHPALEYTGRSKMHTSTIHYRLPLRFSRSSADSRKPITSPVFCQEDAGSLYEQTIERASVSSPASKVKTQTD